MPTLRRLAPALLAALLAFAPAAQARPRSARPLPDVDGLVARTMRAFDAPGVAVALVKDGQVVLSKGYGVRRAGEPAAVDEATLFAIASNTKAFTCAALSVLVQEGRLSWDDPVTKHLPWFQMHDPWVTREITVRDLVTHRSGLGLGEGDLMWWPSTTFSPREIVAGMRQLAPASSLRSRYAYNNVAYVAAGEVLAAVSGRSWEDLVRDRLLQPLGMTSTTASPREGSDLAAPHLRLRGVQRPVPAMRFGNALPAAGLHSTAADLGLWMRMFLECSREGERPAGQVCPLRPESIRTMWTIQTAQPTPEPPKGFETLRAGFAGYGLGFGLRDYRGRKLVSHTGGLPGYVSRVTLVPEERLGIAVLTNQEQTGVFDSIVQQLLDFYLDAPPTDWVSAYRRRSDEQRAKAEAAVAKAAAARERGSGPSLALERYVGRYADPWYGEAVLAVEDGHLVLTMSRTPAMAADLEHWQHDTFLARWRHDFMGEDQPADAYVSFALDPGGAVERMTLAPVSPAIDFSFDYQDLLFRPESRSR